MLTKVKPAWKRTTPRQRIAFVAGIGLVLFTVHNIRQPGIEYIALPSIGALLLIFSVWFAYLHGGKEWTLGDKRVWVPLAIISGSIVIAGAVEWSYHGLGTALMGLVLFSVYLASRWLGKDIFKVFLVAVLVECAFIYYSAILSPGIRTGGFYGGALDRDWTNYAMALRLLVFGALASIYVVRPCRRWWLLVPVGVALFLTGAEEVMLVGIITAATVLLRRDWSKKLLIVPIMIVILSAVVIPTGLVDSLYWRFGERVDAAQTETFDGLNFASGHRLDEYQRVLREIAPFGHGYYITDFGDVYSKVPHNVPIIITDQIGPLAALMWVWVTGFLLFRTRWKYLFVGIFALSILDHALWTQAALWWWAATGVASADNPEGNTDKVFSDATN